MNKSSYFLLSARLQQAVLKNLGWKKLTPVQEGAIPAILNGYNALLSASTAGGKTEAAILPVLSEIYSKKLSPVSTLYISPLIALLNNQESRFRKLSGFIDANVFKWHGDVNANRKNEFIRNLQQILMITPESVEAIFISERRDHRLIFENIRFCIIDEIHAFADADRGQHLMCVLERIQQCSKYDIQRIGLSATVGNPETMIEWLRGSSKRKSLIIQPPKEKKDAFIEICYCLPDENNISDEIIRRIRKRKSLFFVNSRSKAEAYNKVLENGGVESFVHHGSISKVFRERAEKNFIGGATKCIVSTSTLELGIDIGDLDIVCQLQPTSTVSSFLQRLGRTGRRPGMQRNTAFFIDGGSKKAEDDFLLTLAIINLTIKNWVEPIHPSKKCYHILFHQIAALILQNYGITRSEIENLMACSYPLSGITAFEVDEILEFLVDKKILSSGDNIYSLGIEGEKQLSHANFRDLYSVFDTPREYEVRYKNKNVGRLETWFVHLRGNDFSFILAGKYWRVSRIDHKRHILHVLEETKAKEPVWIGSWRLTGRRISQEVKSILMSTDAVPYLNNPEAELLERLRFEYRQMGLTSDRMLVVKEHDNLSIFTFAGSRINAAMGLIFKSVFNADFHFDHKAVNLELDETVRLKPIEEIFNSIRNIRPNVDFLIPPGLDKHLPKTMVSKFQKYLPVKFQNALVADSLLNISGAFEILKSRDFGDFIKVKW